MSVNATSAAPGEIVVSNAPEHRCCSGCGVRGGPWRSEKAARCVNCDVAVAAQRKAWAKEYHAARARAVSKLIKRHHVEFDRLLEVERAQAGPQPE